jgi:hypothetical protein
MAQPFVKILDNKLTLVGTVPQGNPRVVSILGKARMGKSTFFNAVVTHLRKKSEAPFKAMVGDDHCTRGIDSYFLPEHNLLLLDSQGLDYEDASHDPHLLLLLYILSDVILFNDTRRLENGALKLMEPVCTFTNYLDIASVVKPKLYFRIFDSDVKDAQKNLEKVLGTYHDQYQSIRNSIKHLFDGDIRLLKTEPLDRPSKMMLENNMYRELLAEPLGFREAVEAVLTGANEMTSKSVLAQTPDIIEQINSNEEISITKLDIVKLQAENDIHKWIQTQVPDAVYSSIEVDGTQKCFDERVEPRKNAKKSQLAAFTKRFRDVEETIRGPFYKNLSAKMDAPIQKAIEDSRYKARSLVAEQFKQVQADREFPTVNSYKNSFTTIPESYWTGYLRSFTDLEEKIQILYEPIRKEIGNWLCEVYDVLHKTVDKIKLEEKSQAGAVQKLLEEEAGNLESYLLRRIDYSMPNENLVKTNTEIMAHLHEERLKEIQETILSLTTRHTLSFRLEKGVMIPTVLEGNVTSKSEEYDLVKELYTAFLVSLYDYMTDTKSCVCMKLVETKKALLYNKIFPCRLGIRGGSFDQIKEYRDHPWTNKLIKANPEITFVKDSIGANHLVENSDHSIMTSETQIDTYLTLYEAVLEILVSKGYCTKEDAKSKVLMTVETEQGQSTLLHFVKPVTKFDTLLQDLFKRRLEKEFCKQITQKKMFPTLWSEDTETPNEIKHVTINV